MKNILYTILYSFKEIKNSKIFYFFLIFALILISGSYFVSQISFINEGRIMVDFSIFSITIFNVFIGIFIGSSVIYDDIEKKSIFLSITRPVKRVDYLLGRVFGLAVAVVFSTIIMMIIFYGVLLLMHKFVIPARPGAHFSILLLPQPVIIQAVFIIVESVFISAVSILFSLITSKALASILSILIFFIGNTSSKMNALVRPVRGIINGKLQIIHRPNHVLAAIVHFIYAVLPNFSVFNVSTQAAYKVFLSGRMISNAIVYGISYIVVILIIASLIFLRKDLS